MFLCMCIDYNAMVFFIFGLYFLSVELMSLCMHAVSHWNVARVMNMIPPGALEAVTTSRKWIALVFFQELILIAAHHKVGMTPSHALPLQTRRQGYLGSIILFPWISCSAYFSQPIDPYCNILALYDEQSTRGVDTNFQTLSARCWHDKKFWEEGISFAIIQFLQHGQISIWAETVSISCTFGIKWQWS